jgi:hypothetical protein
MYSETNKYNNMSKIVILSKTLVEVYLFLIKQNKKDKM